MPSSRVLLQRADGTAKLRSLSGHFTPIMIDSEAGAIQAYRLVEAGRDEQGPFYTYVEDETLRLPLTRPSEVQVLDGKEDGEGSAAREVAVPEENPGTCGGDRDAPGDGEV